MQHAIKRPAWLDLAHVKIAVHALGAFIKKNIVMFIALLAAVITSIIVPPDKAYLDYFDFKTLTCLFCVGRAVVPAWRKGALKKEKPHTVSLLKVGLGVRKYPYIA